MSNRQDANQLNEEIKAAETSLRNAQAKSTAGWVMILVCVGILLVPSAGPITRIFGILYLGFNIWRLYNAEVNKRKSEDELRESQDKRAKLQDSDSQKE